MNEGAVALEGQTYIVGREGHIYLGDSSVSRKHAEIKFIGGKIHLRDLGSTNGIFLIKGNGTERFREGYVKLHQRILIGKRQCTVQSLLAILGNIAD